MSGPELFDYQIETVDGAEFTVQAPEISIVATTLIASATLGKVCGRGRMFTVVLVGAESLPTDVNWNVVRDSSWPLCLQVLESLRTVRAPQGAAAQPDSFTRLMLLKEEAARRCRSLRFARLAIASRN